MRPCRRVGHASIIVFSYIHPCARHVMLRLGNSMLGICSLCVVCVAWLKIKCCQVWTCHRCSNWSCAVLQLFCEPVLDASLAGTIIRYIATGTSMRCSAGLPGQAPRALGIVYTQCSIPTEKLATPMLQLAPSPVHPTLRPSVVQCVLGCACVFEAFYTFVPHTIGYVCFWYVFLQLCDRTPS